MASAILLEQARFLVSKAAEQEQAATPTSRDALDDIFGSGDTNGDDLPV